MLQAPNPKHQVPDSKSEGSRSSREMAKRKFKNWIRL